MYQISKCVIFHKQSLQVSTNGYCLTFLIFCIFLFFCLFYRSKKNEIIYNTHTISQNKKKWWCWCLLLRRSVNFIDKYIMTNFGDILWSMLLLESKTKIILGLSGMFGLFYLLMIFGYFLWIIFAQLPWIQWL